MVAYHVSVRVLTQILNQLAQFYKIWYGRHATKI
jgi:hypothetical protein